MSHQIFHMYTDGSYNEETEIYGGAFYIRDVIEGSVSGHDPELVPSRNVAGECLAVIRGLKALIDQESLVSGDKVIVYHDYTGLSEWAKGHWKARKPVALKYIEALDVFQKAGLVLDFKKVLAHSGHPENDYVDRLAKRATGLSQ